MHNPVSTKVFSYDFFSRICTLPFWSTCFELELPQISCTFFQHGPWLWFLNTLFPDSCVACCTPHQWTDFAEKWPGKNELFLCELSLIHCEATQGAVLAQLQSTVPCCGNRAGKVQGYLEPVSTFPHTPYTTCYASPASPFIFIQEPCCVLSLIRSICSLLCLLPQSLQFSFITSPPSQVFSTE